MEALSKHQGDLYLDSLGLDTPGIANSATNLSDAAAESLSKHQGDLVLNGLTEISDAAAESLSKFQGYLSLDGLTELSDAAAESFSKHNGQINGQDPKEWNWRYDENGDNRPKGIFGYWK